MKQGACPEPLGSTPGLFELHPALDALSTFLYVKDRAFRVVSANLAFCEALGVSREQLIGQTTDQFLGDCGPESARVDREVVSSGTPRLGVIENYLARDGLRWVVTDKAPILGADGNVVGLVGASIDITDYKKAQDEVESSEARLRFLSENMADILWTMDLNLRTTYVSSSVQRILGFTPEERRLQTLSEMVTPESAARITAALQHHLELEAAGNGVEVHSFTIDVEYYRKDGSTVWLENVVRAIRSYDGSLVGLLGVSRDITERVRNAEALSESEEKYRALFEQSLVPISLVSPEGKVLEANPAWFKMFGYSAEDLPSLNVREQYFAPEERERFLVEMHRTGRLVDDEVRLKRKDGMVVDILRSVSVRRAPDGSIIGFQNVFRDITAQKRAEQALKASEEQYRRLFEHSVDAVSLVAIDGRHIATNPAWFRLFGYTADDLQSLNVRDIYLDPRERDEFLKVIATQERVEGDIQFKRKNGEVFDCHRVVTVVHAPDGSLIGFQAVNRDITAQKQAERALRDSELKYRELFEQSVDAVNLVSTDGRVLEANSAWFKLFGYSREDMGSYRAADAYVEPDGRDRFLEAIARQDRVEDETQFRRKDGSVFDCHRVVTARRALDGSIIGYQTVFHDVTERRKAERALQESEQRFRDLFELSRDAIYLVRPDGRFINVNQAWLDLLGCTREDVSRYDAAHWYADPEGRKRYLERMAKAGDMLDDEVQLRRKDGTVFICQRRIVARKDKHGNTIAFHGVMRDITEQKRAEQALRASEEKYHQLFDQPIAPISLLAPDGHLIEANDAWFQLFGYSRDEVASINAVDLYPTREEREASLRRLMQNGLLLDDESRAKTKDGRIINVLRSMVVRHNADGSVLGYQTVWRDISELKRTRDELYESREQLRRLALRIQEAREEERTAIAQELHDRFSQELTALRLDLESLTQSPPPEGDMGLVRLHGILQLVDRMCQDVRHVISEMRPGMLDDLGLCAAIDWQAGQFSERTGIVCDLTLSADDRVISPALSTTLFRVLQDLLDNVAEHSGATFASVTLAICDDTVYLTVSDNGRGITAAEANGPSSLGILGIRERLSAHGGRLDISGQPGTGTTATVAVPIHPTAVSRQTRLGLD